METEDTTRPKIALDIHAEIPPSKRQHRPTVSKHDRRRNDARLIFNKVIAGRYRGTGNDYSRVGALFVTWEASDLQLNKKNSEVSGNNQIKIQGLVMWSEEGLAL